MTWKCGALRHGITIFPHGKIGPCCKIKASSLKPMDAIFDPNRFAELESEFPPDACLSCISDENQGISSYRQMFNQLVTSQPGIQFLDIRNTNSCNLKCRYCGPHFSNQWAKELNIEPVLKYTTLDQYKDTLITNNLHWMYFTGGEPLINSEHWNLLLELIESGLSQNISLQYNTNLTTIKFKNLSIFGIWKQFKTVSVKVSVDTVGEVSNFIRSGSSWKQISENIKSLQFLSNQSNIRVQLSPVLSILNLWSIEDLFVWAAELGIPVDVIILTGPDYLSLDVIPDQLKSLALEKIQRLSDYINKEKLLYITNLVENNINQCLFPHTLQHILLLDKLRNENLFDHLPFKQFAMDTILKNYEYQ